MDLQQLLIDSAFIIPLILAITLHEAAHAFAANKLGDPTARLAGRMSLDPLKHVDPFGTILLPGLLLLSYSPFLFGYAKPVPVDFRNLHPLRRGMILVALAGPAMNFILAFISALLLHLDAWVTPEQAPWTFRNLYDSVTINVILAIFNLLPILPLDGGRVLAAVLPKRMARYYVKTERYGIVIVLVLFMLPGVLARAQIVDIPIADYLIGVPMQAVRDVILHAAGIGDG